MSYIALYRKWRPLVFDDVVEQEHIVKSLKYSVRTGRIAHAYLFCGTRGTGKTTMAHILSRAINCLNPHDGDPCNKCEICSGILSGSILDVMEIDAASNNSVDNVREIRDEVIYTPSQAKYKVYIIDEVHMLSTGAFNALLKTLEEPPAHVVFILATTEPHKLPATILSRCQRYDFRRITSESIAARLDKIAKANDIQVEKEALKLIARLSDGALRDALSILDQCISLGNKEITYKDVLSITGMVNESFISAFVDSLIKRYVNDTLNMVNTLIMEGKDISQFVSELIVYYRNLLICKIIEDVSSVIETSGEVIETMKTQAVLLEKNEIINTIKELSTLESSIKWSNHPRVMFEVTLIKILSGMFGSINADNTGNSGDSGNVGNIGNAGSIGNISGNIGNIADNDVFGRRVDYSDILKRLTALEEKISTSEMSSKPVRLDRPNTSEEVEENKDVKRVTPRNVADSCKSLEDAWVKVLAELTNCGKKPLCSFLNNTRITALNKNCIGIVFSDQSDVNKKIVSQTDNLQLIEKILNSILGKELRVKCVAESDMENSPNIEQEDSIVDDCTDKIVRFANNLNVPINIYDK
ncbi:MAG TPA: DNA polymerase III subunit gamma/tau [Clostridiales bacterium]|nr:DNA polymerase III subunit gamma/tau [Clostridiales bacterium]